MKRFILLLVLILSSYVLSGQQISERNSIQIFTSDAEQNFKTYDPRREFKTYLITQDEDEILYYLYEDNKKMEEVISVQQDEIDKLKQQIVELEKLIQT